MSSNPPKTPLQESSSSHSDDDDDQQVPSNTQTPSHISSSRTHPQDIPKKQDTVLDQSANTQPIDSSTQQSRSEISEFVQMLASALEGGNVVRPQKPSAFTIRNLMTLQLPRPKPTRINIRTPAPHLQTIRSQEEGAATGMPRKRTRIPRFVEKAAEKRIDEFMKPLPWWMKNIKREKEARVLMPPPGERSSVDNEVEEAEDLELEGPADNQEGEESRFLFPLSESEGEDDLQMLKFLCAYIANGAHLAPQFGRVIVNFINGILAENCRIEFGRFWEHVVALHNKFQRLVQQNGGDNFREADFSRARDYEMAELCKLIWRDRKESERSGPYSDPDTDKLKLVSDNVTGVEGISPGVGVIGDPGNGSSGQEIEVDPGIESSYQGMDVDGGNAAGDLEVNVDPTIGSSDRRKDVNAGNVAGLEVNVDPGIGSSDQGKDVDGGNAASLEVNVDPAIGSSDQGMDVDSGNAADLEVNVDQGDGADREVTLDQGNHEAETEPGVTMDHGNEPDPGAAADQKKDTESVTPLPTELNSPISGNSEQNTREQRKRKRPAWSDDYVV